MKRFGLQICCVGASLVGGMIGGSMVAVGAAAAPAAPRVLRAQELEIVDARGNIVGRWGRDPLQRNTHVLTLGTIRLAVSDTAATIEVYDGAMERGVLIKSDDRDRSASVSVIHGKPRVTMGSQVGGPGVIRLYDGDGKRARVIEPDAR